MSRFRALLIGIAEYRDQGIKDLPFVIDGVGKVGAAIESRGYVIEEDGPGSGRVSSSDLRQGIGDFISNAERGDALLIWLSGHGVHSEGIDYLVPSDVKLNYRGIKRILVPLDEWTADLENTRAASVIFLVDACREGFDEQTMSAGVNRVNWSKSKRLEVAGRKIAFVFACPPGAVSRYGNAPIGDGGHLAHDNRDREEFSLFARAVKRVAEDPEGPATLAEFHDALTDAMSEIADKAGKARQEIRVRTESDHDSFVVFPQRRASAERDSWRQLAQAHPSWDCALGAAGVVSGTEELRALAGRLATHLASVQRKTALAADPWRDPDLGARISERAGFLLSKVLARPDLSPADAALLATAPFIYAAYWSAEAARRSVVEPADLGTRPGADEDRAAFERFARGYPRLLRRTRKSDEASAEIGWWIFHRWLARRPESYRAASLEELLRPVVDGSVLAGEVWEPGRLLELLRCLGADPGFLSRGDRATGLKPRRPVAAGTKDDQMVRERLIGYILTVAHRLAIEPGLLPGTVAEHLGISDPVSLPDLRRTVATARWEPRGQSRVLSAACGHPAVEVALREHVHDLDVLIGDAHRLADLEADLAPLANLPAQVTAEAVAATETPEGRAYTDAGLRFRLDEDRVQQLLMGEQLYGDRALAIRELYQNALDACRYRQARIEYLRRTEGEPSDWTGLISFTQGADDNGRPCIDCTDNGIGMGVRELSEVFAQAGARFADLPEFLEEQAEWMRLSPPIELFPNSRFGIGVMSYFMLADEITIRTCRLGRDGQPGRQLMVSIAGPGNLFRVVDQGPGRQAGTSIRLHLRADRQAVSCAAALREVLWVAEFRTRVTDESGETGWDPGELSMDPVARRGYRRPVEPKVVGSMNAPVWWTSEAGRILADGIATDRGISGAIVSLSGRFGPPLSVDRRKIIGSRPTGVDLLLEQAVPDLLRDPDGIVTWKWLSNFGAEAPHAADLITQDAIATETAWRFGDYSYSASRIGCFSPDDKLFPHQADPFMQDADDPPWDSHGFEGLPTGIAVWRANALGYGANDADIPVLAAVPSDLILLTRYIRGSDISWLNPDAPVPVGHLVAAALKLGRSIHTVADRLSELGYRVPAVPPAIEPSLADLALVDRQFDVADSSAIGGNNWLAEPPDWNYSQPAWSGFPLRFYPPHREYLSHDEPVSLSHVIGAAAHLGRPAAEIAERLVSLGYSVTETSHLPRDLIVDDFDLVCGLPDAQPFPEARYAYLDQAETVPLGHIMRAALRRGWGVNQVATRLRSLGFGVPDVSGLPDDLTTDDLDLVGAAADLHWTWLDVEVPVPVRHVLCVAAQREVSVSTVSARLAELGFELPDLSRVTLESLAKDDVSLIEELHGGVGAECAPLVRISEGQVLRIAAKLQRDPGRVRERLAALGRDVPSAVEAPGSCQDDVKLISSSGYKDDRWLDLSEPVSLRHVLHRAFDLGRHPSWVVDRLRQLGYEVPSVPEGVVDPSRADLGLVRDTCGWDGEDRPVSLGGLIGVAAAYKRPVAELAGRLVLLGFSVPEVGLLPEVLKAEDGTLVSVSPADGDWLDPASQVPLGHILRCAARLNRDVAYVAGRLAELGYSVPEVSDLRRGDEALIREDFDTGIEGDAQIDWLDQLRPVSVAHVFRAALELGRSAEGVVDRLRYLGYTVPDLKPLLSRGRPGPGPA